MWTADETLRVLRAAQSSLLRHWQSDARAALWHLDRNLFSREGVVTAQFAQILAALVAYHHRRAASETAVSASPQPATDPTAPPAPIAAQTPPSIDDPNAFSIQFYADLDRCAQGLADLPLAWPDVRALLDLFKARLRQRLAEQQADLDTLDLNTGFLEAICRRTTDLRMQGLEQELATNREEAVMTQHLAGRFLANASHELRTPLTAVLGFAELLLEESYGPLTSEQTTVIGHIENSAQNLLEIVNNLLDLLHIRAGKLTLQYRPLDPAALLQNLHQILLPLAGRKKVDFQIELEPELGVMEADESILRHIVYHLLASALRATPAGGQVTLRASRNSHAIHIEARDTALHLPPEAISNMLEPFPRLENSPARGYEGWEVGLPLVRRYVELHHGSLHLESLPEQGTVFRVSLPLKRSGKTRE